MNLYENLNPEDIEIAKKIILKKDAPTECKAFHYDPKVYCDEANKSYSRKLLLQFALDNKPCTEEAMDKYCCDEVKDCKASTTTASWYMEDMYLIGAPIVATVLLLIVLFGCFMWRKKKATKGSGSSGQSGTGTTGTTTGTGTSGTTGAPTSGVPTSGATGSGF